VTVAVVALALLALALLATLIHRERAHDVERRELIDRIQAPEAARTAAFARAIDAVPPQPNTDQEDDERFGVVLEDDLLPLSGDI